MLRMRQIGLIQAVILCVIPVLGFVIGLCVYFGWLEDSLVSLSDGHIVLTLYWIVLGIIIIGLELVYLFASILKLKLEWTFLTAIVAVGIAYLLCFPVGTVPDEDAHMNTAYRYSNVMLGWSYSEEDGSLSKRANDASFQCFKRDVSLENYQNLYAHMFDMDADNTPVKVRVGNVNTCPFLYILSGAGITVGRLLGLGTAMTMLLGRLFNLAFYIIAVFMAIKIIPIAKMILFGVSMLPMTVHLAASYNYDSIIFGLAFLTIAYWMKLAYQNETVTWKDLLLGCLLNLFLAPCKLVNFFICCLCLLIPSKKIGSRKKWLLFMAIAIGVAAVSLGIFQLNTISHYGGGGTHILAWANAETYTLSWILRNPFVYVYIIVHTLIQNVGQYMYEMVGYYLGWLNFPISNYCILGFILLLPLCVIRMKDEPVFLKGRTKLFLCGIIFCYAIMVLTGMMVGWTPLGYSVIAGVQGRYFLPILPLIMLLFRTEKVSASESINSVLSCSLTGLQFLTVALIFKSF